MLITHQHPLNKSLLVTLAGVPNAGKSSLVNSLMGQPLTAVTYKPQTTRNQMHCRFEVGHTEIVVVDTPGLHYSAKEMNKRMNQQVTDAADGVDLRLVVVDLTRPIGEQMEILQVFFKRQGHIPSWIIFNKCDSFDNLGVLNQLASEYYEKIQKSYPEIPFEAFFVVSAKDKTQLKSLEEALCERAPSAPHLYPDGSMSNKSERFFVAEYIREQAFLALEEEIPYEMAVVVDDMKDLRGQRRRGRPKTANVGAKDKAPEEMDSADHAEKKEPCEVFIQATIWVNRPSQRGIVIGSGGELIKKIGTEARIRIEELLGARANLNLHVKVIPKWFKNNKMLEQIGLPRAMDSKRVWRKR